MNTLLADRLRRRHGSFLRAATRFPCLFFAAVTPRCPDRSWPAVALDPSVPERERTYKLGLAAGEFWTLLPRRTVGDFPVKETWLQTDGRIWHGVYFGGVVPGHVHEPPAESADWVSLRMCHPLGSTTWPRCLQNGIAEFDRLAADVAGQIALPPPEGPDPRFPPSMPDGPIELAAVGVTWRTSTDLWLEVVCGMDFVDRYAREGFLIRRLPSDVFTASARAIEALQEREETPLAGNWGKSKSGAAELRKPGDPREPGPCDTGQLRTLAERQEGQNVPTPSPESTTSPSKPVRRPCYDRDHLWLAWHENSEAETSESYPKIRDKWNAMSDAEREKYGCPKKLPAGKSGWDRVRKGIATARKERGGKVES